MSRATAGIATTVIAVLAALAALPAAAGTDRRLQSVGGPVASLPAGHDLVFVVGGDNRPTSSGAPVPRVFGAILDEVALIHPDLVVWSGDSIYGYCEDKDTMEREYRRFLGAARKVGVPFFNSPGNHEIRGDQRCAKMPDCDGACAEGLFAGHFGNLYGSFDVADVHFIALDTERVGEEGRIGPTQMQWLGDDLEKNKDKRAIFVFSHGEFYSAPQIDPDAASNHLAIANRDELHQLFHRYPVKAVFSGHEHLFWREKPEDHDGIAYFVAGGSGAPLYASPDRGGFSHYLVMQLKGDALQWDVIEPGRFYVEKAERATKPGDPRVWLVNSTDAAIPVRGMQVTVPRSLGPCARLAATTGLKTKDGKPVEISVIHAAASGNTCRLTLSLAAPARASVPVAIGKR